MPTKGEYPYFIADIGSNHEGSLDRAIKLITLAKESGADAVKFQHYKAKSLVSEKGFSSADVRAAHQDGWKSSVFSTYRKYETPVEWTNKLASIAKDLNIDFLTSPYDWDTVEKLEGFVSSWKIGSGDITWLQMIERLCRTGKPIILATGASTLEEVSSAVDVVKRHGNKLTVLQCNTNYTAAEENFDYINLRVIEKYASLYNVPVGISDHTKGSVTVLGAIALGATVIEKHFTDNCSRKGPDHKFAMDPEEWRKMVDDSKRLFRALGSDQKVVEENELDTVVAQRRGLILNKNKKKLDTITNEDIDILRPCPRGCLTPAEIKKVLNKKLIRQMNEGEALKLNDVCND